MSYQRKDENEESDAQYSKMDEEPEPFYLWPLLRIVFGVIILGLSIAEVVLLARIWTKEYNRLADITFDTPTPVKYYLYNMTSVQYQGNRAVCWFVFSNLFSASLFLLFNNLFSLIYLL